MTIQDTFEFSLSSPIKIQGVKDGKNQFIEQDILYLTAPSQKQMRETLNLKQSFLKSIFGMARSFSKDEVNNKLNKEQSDSKFDAKGIIAALNLGSDRITDFYSEFESYLTSGVAFVNKSLDNRINSQHIELLSIDDFEQLVAKYIEVFFIQSWMKGMSED